MSVSRSPEPHGPRRLSPREEAVLARIESDLVDEDPALARLATNRPPALGVRSPVSARDLGLLIVILLVLVATAIVLPSAPGWVLPGLTVLLVASWMVLCARRSTADR